MASVFKRRRWVDAQGRKCRKGTPGAMWQESRYYTVQIFVDGKPKLIKGYTDKQASEQLGAKLERAKAKGEQGLIDPYKPHRKRPLAEHVVDWTAELRVLGRDDMYIAPCKARLERLMGECGWTTLGDISADSFCKWRQTATGNADHNREDKTKRTIRLLSPKAKNHYLATLNTFCRWCMKRNRLAANPVADVEKVDETADVRRQRRALTAEELVRLLDAVPEHYRLGYQVLMATGLRRSELLALRWGDVKLNAPHPFIQLRAADTKGKRADVLPVRADLAELLRKAKGGAGDGELVVTVLPRIPTHRKYLDAAGISWLDDAGRRADLHALRHSYGTLLSKGGVTPREAMSLMRHSDLRLTMKVYTDPRIFDLAGAVEKLPINLAKPGETKAAEATGTDGKSADADATPPAAASTRRDGGRSKSVSSRSAGIGSCSASIGGHDGQAESTLTLATGGHWQQKTPSDEDGVEERAMGFEPTTTALGRLHSTTELRPQCCVARTIPRIRGKSIGVAVADEVGENGVSGRTPQTCDAVARGGCGLTVWRGRRIIALWRSSASTTSLRSRGRWNLHRPRRAPLRSPRPSSCSTPSSRARRIRSTSSPSRSPASTRRTRSSTSSPASRSSTTSACSAVPGVGDRRSLAPLHEAGYPYLCSDRRLAGVTQR